MPAPTNERQSFEQERAKLSEQIADYERDLDATLIENRGRREMREWQIRREKKRLADVEVRLAAIRAEGP